MKKKNGMLLSEKYPELYSLIDIEKNVSEGIDISSITCGINKEIWWKYNDTISYKMGVWMRIKVRNKGIEYEPGGKKSKTVLVGLNDIFTLRPQLINEWDFERNDKEGINPYEVSRYSLKSVWWICPMCKRSFRAKINEKVMGGHYRVCQ